MGTKIFGPQKPNDAPGTVQNNDLVVNSDGSINTKLVDTVTIANVKIEDGATPTKLKVNVDGSINVAGAFSTAINASGVPGDPAPAEALQVGGKDSLDTLIPIKVSTDGTVHVEAAGTLTGDQGAPNTPANGWPVKVTDGLETLTVNPDGSINVVAQASGTTTANQGTPASPANGWPVKLTDGADTVAVNVDGSLNVNVTGGTITAATVADQGAAQSVGGAWPVKLTDGVDSVTVRTDGSIDVNVVSGSLTAIATNDQGAPNIPDNAWPVKLTDGVDVVGVRADGSIDVNVVTGSITANNSQGVPNTSANGWPVKLTDGTDVVAVNDDGSLSSRITDGIDTLAVNGDGSINVSITGNTGATTAHQGNPNTAAKAWPVMLTDGTDTVAVNADGSLKTTGTITGTVSASITGSLPAGVNMIGKTVGYSHLTTAPATGQKVVNTSYVELFAGTTGALAGRRIMAVRPVGDIYIGGSGVTTQTGWLLKANEMMSFDFDPSTAAPVYAVASAATVCYVMEVK